MPEQGGFAAVVPVKPGHGTALRDVLKGIDANLESGTIPFGRMTTVHFLRWFVLEASQDADGKFIPACLVFSTNYDEPLDAHLDELLAVSGAGFDAIYEHCEGYDATAKGDRRGFLRRHAVEYAAFYIGTRGRGVQQIRDEDKLRSAIQDYLNTLSTRSDAAALRKGIQDHIRSKSEFAWALTPGGAPPKALKLMAIAGPAIAAALLLFVALCAAAWWLFGDPWWLYPPLFLLPLAAFVLVEQIEPVEDVSDPLVELAELQNREDHVVQNQLTNVVLVKRGWLRRTIVRRVLFAIGYLGRKVYVRGALGGIPTIHFARWILLDRGRRILFMSNFDGSWENYLGDFIDKARIGLTAIWSNAIGCPRALFLVSRGAADEAAFKTWVRRNQMVTQVWYSAYRHLSVENINQNTRIRNDLFTELSDADVKHWLSLL